MNIVTQAIGWLSVIFGAYILSSFIKGLWNEGENTCYNIGCYLTPSPLNYTD